jgi:membrane-associated phospholipid phosphatase
MNKSIITNFSKLKPTLFYIPLFLILTIVMFLYSQDALNVSNYIAIQKDCFYFINHHLGQYPTIQYNLTQLGDATILLTFFIIFIIYAPKIWEALLTASVVSLILSFVLKNIFLVPRASEVFDNSSFIIIGKTAGGYGSLPSGHSITVFTTLTILLFAFMPEKLKYKILWVFSILLIGLIIVSSRIGVGAHYPLDVIIGSIAGYISGLLGIFISRKYKFCNWMSNKKCFPIFIAFILICCITTVIKITTEGCVVFYLTLIALFVSLYKIIYVYIKK